MNVEVYGTYKLSRGFCAFWGKTKLNFHIDYHYDFGCSVASKVKIYHFLN